MPDPRVWFVPAILSAQILLTAWASSGEKRPTPPDAATFPTSFGAWTRHHEVPVDAVAAQLGADRVVEYIYTSGAPLRSADLFVAWFQSQRSGTAQPHSPLVCIPGNGWIIETKKGISLSTDAGILPATLLVTAKGAQRSAVIFWYQSAFRAAPGEWESKLWMVFDLFREKRTDIALVRVVAFDPGDQSAVATAAEVARQAHPLVIQWLRY